MVAAIVAWSVQGVVPVVSAAEHVDWAPSQEELIKRFLGALRSRDAAALRGLRVTESEYCEVILPGSVAPGERLRAWPEEVTRYFWGQLNGKSLYSEQQLLQVYGGNPYVLKATEFTEGEQEYATYKAYKKLRLRLQVEGEPDREAVLDTGSIAEIGGRFKFISFVRD